MKINEELEVSAKKIITEDITIEFYINFIKYNIRDIYYINLKRIHTYILERMTTPVDREYYFDSINNHFLFFYEEDITEEQISAIQKFLMDKIIAFTPKVLLNQENLKELTQCITDKVSYPAHLMRPVRNFSLKMDTIALYQGEYLDNLSYHVMRDYMNRFDTAVELVSAYEVGANRQRLRIENLEQFQPKKGADCEIYIYAKVLFKEVVVNPPAPFYIGITFATLETFLNNQHNFISRLAEVEGIYTFNNFFALETYQYSKIHHVINQIVHSWTEVVPARYLAERLNNSFDVYLSNPLES